MAFYLSELFFLTLLILRIGVREEARSQLYSCDCENLLRV